MLPLIRKYPWNDSFLQDEAALQRIALSLQDSLGDGSTKQLIGAIVALAARPTFPLLPSQRSAFVKFMVKNKGFKLVITYHRSIN